MFVKIRVYATLRRYVPTQSTEQGVVVELPPAGTIGDALDKLSIPRREAKVCFVNGLQRELAFGLADGDELGLFPPIGGG